MLTGFPSPLLTCVSYLVLIFQVEAYFHFDDQFTPLVDITVDVFDSDGNLAAWTGCSPSPCSITASLNDTSRDPYPFTTGDNLSRNRSAVLVADEAGNFSTTQCLLPTGCTLRSGSLTVLGDAENGTAVFSGARRFFSS